MKRKGIYLGVNIFLITILFSTKLSGQVVINEVHMQPAGSSTASNPQNLADCTPNDGGEFIELYNTSPCTPIDISCYIVATNVAGTSASSHGAFRFPAGTILPPLGFVSIGGTNSGATFTLNTYCGTADLVTHTTGRWYMPNGDGYMMLYNSTGTAIDAVYWTIDGNASKWGTDSDINTNPTRIPTGTGGCPVVASLSGPANLPITDAEHIGISSNSGLSSSRQTDGSLTWIVNSPKTINACNGVCVISNAFSTTSIVVQPTCGSSNGSISLTQLPIGTYSYVWSPNVSSSNSANSLPAGPYTITVNDGSCSWDTTITLAATAPFTLGVNISQPTCAGNDGNIIITPNPVGSYTYTWTPNISSTNSAINLSNGSFSIHVSDGTCFKDTFVVLNPPTGCGCVIPLVLNTDSIANTKCGGTSACNYSGPSILINEINLYPTSGDGSIFGNGPTGAGSGEGEWIELYNPNWCDSIDISGYFLGSYNSTGNALTIPASDGMGFLLPAGTVVPPLGFVVVRGSNAPVPAGTAKDIVISNLGGNLCIDGGISTTRIWFQNAGGWFGFYNAAGVPQDIVKWGSPTASDLNGQPCVPSNSSVPSLLSANASGITVNLGVTPAQGQNYVRIPDGGAWTSVTQSENSSIGTCNDLVNGCVTSSGGTSSCNGIATVNVTSGAAGPYTYQWNDPLNQTTATADSLCPGTYCVTVTDASGLCIENICVEVLDSAKITFTAAVIQPSCNNNDGEITLTPDSLGNYTYTWSPTVSSSNTANNLVENTYSINVVEANCSFDTTINLVAPPSFTISTNVVNSTCQNSNGNIELTPSSVGNYTYTWLPNISSTNTGENLNQGNYSINVVDTNNCSIDTTISIANIGYYPIISYTSMVTDSTCSYVGYVENLSSGSTIQNWYIDGIMSGNGASITFDFDNNSSHSIALEVFSIDNCKIDTTITISNTVNNDKPIFVPNVFSPSLIDGMNDIWKVSGECIKDFKCSIFNRWGNLIYTLNDITEYWDGKSGGKEMSQGTYFYVIEVTKANDSKETFKGTITKL